MALEGLFGIVLPVFGFIALGYLLIALRVLPADRGDALGEFVFMVAVPLLLFRSLGTLELPDISPWPLWLTYFFGVAVNIVVGIVITERLFKRDARSGVLGAISTSYSNLVMVGIPVFSKAFGEEGLVVGFLLVAVHLPVMMLVSSILIEIGEHRDGVAKGPLRLGPAMVRVARSLIKNPLIIAILAGSAFRASGLPLEGVPRTVINGLSDTAIPLALVSLGMSLHKYGIRGNVGPALALSALKLGLMPLVVYLVAVHVAGLPPLATAVVVLGAACPTGVNAYLFAVRFQTGLALSANTITLTTVISLLTFSLWLTLFGA
ncbi:MAG: AEC family transporter [Pseudomonadota bacterium]